MRREAKNGGRVFITPRTHAQQHALTSLLLSVLHRSFCSSTDRLAAIELSETAERLTEPGWSIALQHGQEASTSARARIKGGGPSPLSSLECTHVREVFIHAVLLREGLPEPLPFCRQLEDAFADHSFSHSCHQDGVHGHASAHAERHAVARSRAAAATQTAKWAEGRAGQVSCKGGRLTPQFLHLSF